MDALEKAERTVALAKTHIAGQQERIEAQRRLIARLEADEDDHQIVKQARELLKDMLDTLDRMLADRREAAARLAQFKSRDEERLDAVMRDSPL